MVVTPTEHRIGRPLPGNGYCFNPILLRAAIVARGESIRGFARSVGIAKVTIHNLLRGERCSMRLALKVCEVLAVQPETSDAAA